ncbi:MAG: penicillin-binding protein 2 [Planktomarina sp.]
MKRSADDNSLSSVRISRRALIVGAAQLGMVGILSARMKSLQIDQSDQFRLLAEENRINVRLLPPTRGLIHDRAGRPVALNVPNYRIVMVREDAGDVDEVLATLARLIPIDPDDITKAKAQMAKRSPFLPVTVTENLSWENFAKVAANAPVLPGITTDVGLSRTYPQKENLAHVVGYVGPVSDYDLSKMENPDPLLQIPRFQIGKSQVETKMETALRGTAGTQRIEVNAVGRVMRELSRVEGQRGKDIVLSIDSKLQNYALARMADQSASAVVMDVTNGDVLAIASTPTFDPNLFIKGISVADYSALRDNKYGPLRAKAVQGTYSPASTFKMIVALTALEEGIIKPEDEIRCNGQLEVSNNKFHCWKRGGHGKMDLAQSLAQSCDVYYYTIAQEIGIEKISAMAERFGLGIKHDLPLSAVRSGLVPTMSWKAEVRGEDWLIGDTVNASIGQGFMLASPLQLAVMSARLATGRSVSPRLIRRIDGIEQPSGAGEDIGVKTRNLHTIQDAMYAVMSDRKGTARRSQLDPDDMKIAGKTGTSQVRRITAAERAAGVIRNEDRPWEHRDHALFVNFAPYHDPRYAVAVVVEHGGSGSSAAAPIARDITAFALHGDLPPLSMYPAAQRPSIEAQQKEIVTRLQQFDTPINTQSSDQA